MKNIHWPAIGAAAMSVVGFVALNSQTIAQYVPPKAAGTVLLAGIVAQAITKAVKKQPAATLTVDGVSSSGYLMGSGRDGTA